MRDVVIPTKSEAEADEARVSVQVRCPDPSIEPAEGEDVGYKVLTAVRPKDGVIARAVGIFHDKYAPDPVVAKTAFDFLETTLSFDSWAYVVNRLNDRDDDFDTEGIIAIFEAIFDEFKDAMPEEPTNRAQRRGAAKRTPSRR
jgi:hypothetical protein